MRINKFNLWFGLFNLTNSILITIRYPFGSPYVWVSFLLLIAGVSGIVFSINESSSFNTKKKNG